jgi:hypothetical protein
MPGGGRTGTLGGVPHPGAIDEFVADLDRRLYCPDHLRGGILAELRERLFEAAEAYERAGLARPDAQRRAVRHLGVPVPLKPAAGCPG